MQAVIATIIIIAAVAYIVVRITRRLRRRVDCPPGKSRPAAGCTDCEADCPLRQPKTSTFE